MAVSLLKQLKLSKTKDKLEKSQFSSHETHSVIHWLILKQSNFEPTCWWTDGCHCWALSQMLTIKCFDENLLISNLSIILWFFNLGSMMWHWQQCSAPGWRSQLMLKCLFTFHFVVPCPVAFKLICIFHTLSPALSSEEVFCSLHQHNIIAKTTITFQFPLSFCLCRQQHRVLFRVDGRWFILGCNALLATFLAFFVTQIAKKTSHLWLIVGLISETVVSHRLFQILAPTH